MFSRLIQLAVGLAIGTNGIEMILLSYLIPCVTVDWDLTTLQEGSLTASVFAGELVRGAAHFIWKNTLQFVPRLIPCSVHDLFRSIISLCVFVVHHPNQPHKNPHKNQTKHKTRLVADPGL